MYADVVVSEHLDFSNELLRVHSVAVGMGVAPSPTSRKQSPRAYTPLTKSVIEDPASTAHSFKHDTSAGAIEARNSRSLLSFNSVHRYSSPLVLSTKSCFIKKRRNWLVAHMDVRVTYIFRG